jgi:hypothetical protein
MVLAPQSRLTRCSSWGGEASHRKGRRPGRSWFPSGLDSPVRKSKGPAPHHVFGARVVGGNFEALAQASNFYQANRRPETFRTYRHDPGLRPLMAARLAERRAGRVQRAQPCWSTPPVGGSALVTPDRLSCQGSSAGVPRGLPSPATVRSRKRLAGSSSSGHLTTTKIVRLDRTDRPSGVRAADRSPLPRTRREVLPPEPPSPIHSGSGLIRSNQAGLPVSSDAGSPPERLSWNCPRARLERCVYQPRWQRSPAMRSFPAARCGSGCR